MAEFLTSPRFGIESRSDIRFSGETWREKSMGAVRNMLTSTMRLFSGANGPLRFSSKKPESGSNLKFI